MQKFHFQDDGTYPNNKLPVLYYEHAFENTDTMQDVFKSNLWRNSWVNGILPYHHYHSTAHEVLGVLSGHATVQLGGPDGEQLNISSGDVIVLPAGTAHKRIQQSDDFQVLGAYPDGMSFDTKTDKPGEYEQALQHIPNVPIPKQDPVTGDSIWS
ncbi:cupin domain-containing protein [Terribacillus saccharophilus]|uniref:cupin domain-containing protein n=1 Tax=Terribacillus saccharophilus TaxID=361277 RepID=UPI002DD1F75D|nr:cupin domain-containing protein [Terribacillus saccharophilus]